MKAEGRFEGKDLLLRDRSIRITYGYRLVHHSQGNEKSGICFHNKIKPHTQTSLWVAYERKPQKVDYVMVYCGTLRLNH